MLKKTVAVLTAFMIMTCLLPVSAATDYDEVGAYTECCTLYPDFVNRVKSFGVNDDQIITFLSSVEEHLLSRENELCEENFDEYMFDAIKAAFKQRKNIKVRDALGKAYPSSVNEALSGVVPEEFMPIYETVKRFLFGIKTPVVTLSVSYGEGENVFYAHSTNIPENCVLLLALYDSEGALLHAKTFSSNTEGDGIHCSCAVASAKAFAWDKNTLAPVCDSYEILPE